MVHYIDYEYEAMDAASICFKFDIISCSHSSLAFFVYAVYSRYIMHVHVQSSLEAMQINSHDRSNQVFCIYIPTIYCIQFMYSCMIFVIVVKKLN